MSEIMIETKALSFIYTGEEGERLVLDNIDLTIERGSFVAIIGHNGSGKSTLAKHFNAVLLPSGGKVYVDGIDTTDEARLFDIRQRAGMAFQNPDNQIVATIVEEDVAFAPENLGVPQKEIVQRVEHALKAVDMWEYREHAAHQLSGGQKQRVAIAGIIAMRPLCIVLDEPTAMLDPQGRKEVLKTIQSLNKDEGITIILITHYMNEAAMADRVVVLDGGKIAMDGTPREVFCRQEELLKLGLEAPQAAALVHRLREKLPSLPEVLTPTEAEDAIAALLEGGV
ncbi:Energy-coupling factor transporter ATP-binding protein EcfA1 [bioreactor metagenome]|uniref:Energy-coupling factor transporter ATP-binding protein EcfA1 n=1 Tax=bioreactor metagenome TaxID=1076179 RepID=A0A644XZD9_9ZZZZ